MSRGIVCFTTFCAGFLACESRAAISGGFGILGDSACDEYRADDNRGGAYAATTLNWVELLVRYRSLDCGPWGARGQPRRTGYEYNWARSGATAASLVEAGQHTGLADQVASGLVDHVFVHVGANDFSTSGRYDEIYDGTLAGEALAAEIQAIADDIMLALDTVLAAGAENVFLATIPDRGMGPVYMAAYPDAAKRQLVSAAVQQVNTLLTDHALTHGIVVVDTEQLAVELFSGVDAAGMMYIGGEAIDFLTPGDEPHHAILGDAEHGGTVVSGLIANFYIDALNPRGLGLTPFTEEEIIENAGIGLLPPDTQFPTVSLTAPSNNSTVSGVRTVSASASDNVGVVAVRFTLDDVDLAEDTTAPYSISWNTAQTPNGLHQLRAIARDAAGNAATSAVVNVTINNDTTPPVLNITAPAPDSTVSGTRNVTASASDNVRVVGVQFTVDGVNLGSEDTSSPYSRSWNTTSATNGPHVVSAVARDAAGNFSAVSFSVTVNNLDTTPPSVSFTSPASGATVLGTINLSASASDNRGVIGVEFKVNGASVGGEDVVSPFSVSWDTTTVPDGPYTLTATARDAAGNATTATRAVTVRNQVPPPPVTLYPDSYVVTQGSLTSGSAASLASDNNSYLVTRSAMSGMNAVTQTEASFPAVTSPATRIDVRVIAKSSTSSTRIGIAVFNVATGAWTELTSATTGTSERTFNVAITSNPADYIDAAGVVRVRVQSSKLLGSHSVSIDLMRLVVTY